MMVRLRAVIVILMMMVAACDAETPTVTPRPSIVGAVPPSPVVLPILPTAPGNTPQNQDQFTPGFNYTLPAPIATSASLSLDIPVGDVIFSGTFYRGGAIKPGTVLLLHDVAEDRTKWAALAGQLQRAGLNVIAVDWRGYGQSGGQPDWDRADRDLSALLAYVRTLGNFDGNRMALVGVGSGATLAVVGCASDRLCKVVVAVSPARSQGKLNLWEALPNLGSRPLLLIGAESEKLSELAETVIGEKTLRQVPGSATGSALIARNEQIGALIVSWLLARL